jgi:hypothetical protein
MSSIYSDPPFPRGGTLLGFQSPATLDDPPAPATPQPIEGRDIAGEVKVFVDANPFTGQVNSQRLVYCVAVRAKQTGVTNGNRATNLTAGKVVKFAAGSLSELDADNQAASTDNAAIAGMVGVVDEYLPQAPLVNDLFWVVVKGPTSALFTTAAVSTAGVPVQVSSTAGQLVAAASPAITQRFAGTALGTKDNTGTAVIRVNLNNRDV